LLKPSGVPSYRGEGVGQIVIYFYSGQKSLIYSLFCSIYGICGGWLKTSYGMGEGGGLNCSKNRHMIFGRSLIENRMYLTGSSYQHS